jgi:hypothetical protein
VILEPEQDIVLLSTGEDLGSHREAVAGAEQVLPDRVVGEEPGQVGAAAGSLLRGDAALPHQALLRVRRRREDRRVQPPHEAPGVTLVPRGREHGNRLPPGRALDDLVREGQRVEKEQTFAVLDRIRRDDRMPRLTFRPLRVLRLPVPQGRP